MWSHICLGTSASLLLSLLSTCGSGCPPCDDSSAGATQNWVEEVGARVDWWLPPTPLKLCYPQLMSWRDITEFSEAAEFYQHSLQLLFLIFFSVSLKTGLWLGFGMESMSLKIILISSSWVSPSPAFLPVQSIKISCVIISVSSAHTNRLLEAGSKVSILSSILAGTQELIDK